MSIIRKYHHYFLKCLGIIVLCLITIFFLFWILTYDTFKYLDHFIVELLPQNADQWGIGTSGALSGDFLKSSFPQLFNDDCVSSKDLKFEYRFTFYKEGLLHRRQIAVFNDIDIINRNNINDHPNFRVYFDLKRSCLFEFLLDKQTQYLHISQQKGDTSIVKKIKIHSNHFLISCDIALYVSVHDTADNISFSPIIKVMQVKTLYFYNNRKGKEIGKEIMLKLAYDQQGQRTLSESGEFSTQYTYTPHKLVESIVQGDKSVQYSYNVAGQKISAKTPAITSTYSYDDMGRLTKIDHSNIAHYDYQWDAANRIVSMNDGKYDYDKTSQLIGANYVKLPAEKYNYDLNGNRSNYRTEKNNQLLHDGENVYEYDSEGNRISNGSTKYFWDHRNRLVKVETPQETVEYVYDYKNRLVCRSTSKGSEYFIHDGWQIILTLNQTGSVTNKFLWGAKQDELVAQNSVYALCDHLGTVRDLIGNGISDHFEYNVFGQLLSKIGNTDSLFKYTGKMTDTITGLQWNINRWYDAKVGRWINEDPIGFLSDDTNLSRYVKNKLLNYTDNLGLADCIAETQSQNVMNGPFRVTLSGTYGTGTWTDVYYWGKWDVTTSGPNASVTVSARSNYSMSIVTSTYASFETRVESNAIATGSVTCVWNTSQHKCLTSSVTASGGTVDNKSWGINIPLISSSVEVSTGTSVYTSSTNGGVRHYLLHLLQVIMEWFHIVALHMDYHFLLHTEMGNRLIIRQI
jgi:RHS repeat-associated protein